VPEHPADTTLEALVAEHVDRHREPLVALVDAELDRRSGGRSSSPPPTCSSAPATSASSPRPRSKPGCSTGGLAEPNGAPGRLVATARAAGLASLSEVVRSRDPDQT